MCGLAGIISTTENSDTVKNKIENMKRVIRHRGPDGHGTAMFATNNGYTIGLGHQRLAIIDPNAGKQPMVSVDGNFTIVFNGAIYNYLELRRELIAKGAPIKTYSD